MADNQGLWVKAFCPGARCLTDAEIASLPEDQRQAMEGKDGLWLDVFCPDKSCLTEGETGQELKLGADAKGREGFWLTLFCPGGSCIKDF